MMYIALMISLELITWAESLYTDVYNFPMIGTLQYHSVLLNKRATYGSVTIVHPKMVLCASENLFQLDIESVSRFIITGVELLALKVVAGSDIMLSPNDDYEKDKVQIADVKDVYVALDSSFLLDVTRDKTDWNKLRTKNSRLVTVASNLSSNLIDNWRDGKFPDKFKFNPFRELQWDVAILVLDEPGFTWSKYILPIPFHWKDNTKLNQQYIDFWDTISAVEKHPHNFVPCSVPGWSTIGNNEIIYHRVVYVRFKDCEEAICGVYPSTCLRYLNVRQHICFKSLGFADSCVMDQGAPVVCKWANDPSNNPLFLGILVKAFECGTQGLPLVFTRTYTIATFARVGLEPADFGGDNQEPALEDPQFIEDPIII